MSKDELKQIARELVEKYAAKELQAGYIPSALHVYDDESGNLLYFRPRLKHPDGPKWIRPFYFHTKKKSWVIGEPKFKEGKPLYHLSILAKNPQADVWIVEGEQKVDLLEKFGFVATTSGSGTSASEAFWTVLQGRNIIIWPDSDEVGLKYAQEITGKLKSLNCTVRCIDVNQLNLPEGGDIVDWIELNPNTQSSDILSLPLIDTIAQDWPELLPLITSPSPEPYPLEALPETIREAVTEVQGFTKAPIPLVAASALATLSLAGQSYVDIKRADKLCGPTSLFLITIADSGERKSTCDAFFTKPIRDFEEAQTQITQPLIKIYNAKTTYWQAKADGIKTKIRQLSGKESKREELQKFESDLLELEKNKPQAPKIPRLIYCDVTPEALKCNLATVWPSSGIISSEGGIVFGAHGMNSDSVMRNLATYNQGWDGKGIPTDRRTSESFKTEEVRLTMAIQVQEPTLREFTSRLGTLARGTGFFARVLFSWPESTQGQRLFTEPPKNWPCLSKFHQYISLILKQPFPIDNNGILKPKLMTLAELAKLAWIKFHDGIENELHNSGELYDIRDVASKAADNAARLACLFHLIEYGLEGEVSLDSFDRASAIVLWHLREAQRFLGELTLPPELAKALKLESWLISFCQKKKTNQIPIGIVQQFGPYCLRKKETLQSTLYELQALNRVRLNVSSQPKYIEVNPKLIIHGGEK